MWKRAKLFYINCIYKSPTFQIVYSLGSTIIQHLIPSLIVSVAYTLISRRIANRMATSNEQQNQLELKQRKNNYMLVSNHNILRLHFGKSWPVFKWAPSWYIFYFYLCQHNHFYYIRKILVHMLKSACFFNFICLIGYC